jgi:DNA invertase Pin-like site-specific DNA recombinase
LGKPVSSSRIFVSASTLDQNPDLQLDALKASGCSKLFVEKAPGAKEDRPQLLAALDYLRDGDTLVVWKLDRLARSIKQLIETVDQLKARGIGFRSLTEAIDTTTAAGELFFHIFGALAQFERSIIRERTNAGLKAALARGRKGGRRSKVKPDDIRAALALLNDPQISVRSAAKRLGLSVSTLYRHAPGLRARVGEKG